LVYALDKQQAQRVFSNMVLIREVETQISTRYKEGKMRCPTHLSIGQESVPSVFSAFLSNDDYAVSTHRSHAHYLAKGGDLEAMLAEIYGLEQGCSKGRGGSMHLADLHSRFMGSSAIVGNSIPIGTGLGLAAKMDSADSISVVYLGDAAVEEGVFYESANFAATSGVPVLFACENNGFSVFSNFEVRQPKGRRIHEMVGAMGVRSKGVSSFEPELLVQEVQAAVEHCRKSREPYFLEIETARFLEHCGPGDDSHLEYRDATHLRSQKVLDPLSQFKSAMLGEGLDVSSIELETKIRVNSAFTQVEKWLDDSKSLGKGI